MKKVIIKKMMIICLFLLIILLSGNFINASALEFGGIPALKEIALPNDLNFKINDTCSKYDYFIQAAARKDGWFLVYARQVDTDGNYNVDMKKVYIDIYDEDGTFVQELYFTISQNIDVEFGEETINVYLYDSVLTYNLETEELHNYAIPKNATSNEEFIENYRKKDFESGEWQYSSKTSFGKYTKLVRTNGNGVQTLVRLKGANSSSKVAFLQIRLLPIIAVVAIVVVFWRRRKNRWRQNKLNTPDGSVCLDEK